MVVSIPKKKAGRRAVTLENAVKLAVPGENDILCGKDRSCSLHKGSQHFKTVIDSYRTRYQNTKTKYDKMQITKEIYEVLSQTSHFLKYNEQDRVWEEISPLAARDKVGHALRFANNHHPGSKLKKGNNIATTNKNKSRSKSSSKMPHLGRSHLPRNSSFSSSNNSQYSASAGSSGASIGGSSTSHHRRASSVSKADLVASLVEVAKEEPKVWDSVVDHLTHQQQYTHGENASNLLHYRHHDGAQPDEAISSGYATGFSDPVALENIAYAVESKTDDDALDELIHMLNNDATEEFIQDVLEQANVNLEPQVPPSVTVNISASSSGDGREQDHTSYKNDNSLHESGAPETGYCGSTEQYDAGSTTSHEQDEHTPLPDTSGNIPTYHRQLLQHKRIYTADDDMWSVMKEPLPLQDLAEKGELDGYDWQ